jgi:hypothetical protein
MEKSEISQYVFVKEHEINWDDVTVSEVEPNLRHGKYVEATHVAVARESNQPIKYKFVCDMVIDNHERSRLLAVSVAPSTLCGASCWFCDLIDVLKSEYGLSLHSSSIFMLLIQISFHLPLLFFYYHYYFPFVGIFLILLRYERGWGKAGVRMLQKSVGPSSTMSGFTYCFCAICPSLSLLHYNSVILPTLVCNLYNLFQFAQFIPELS